MDRSTEDQRTSGRSVHIRILQDSTEASSSDILESSNSSPSAEDRYPPPNRGTRRTSRNRVSLPVRNRRFVSRTRTPRRTSAHPHSRNRPEMDSAYDYYPESYAPPVPGPRYNSSAMGVTPYGAIPFSNQPFVPPPNNCSNAYPMSHTPQQYQWYPPPPPPAESKPPSTTTQVPKSENIQKPDPELEALRREVEAIKLQDNRKEEARKQRELEEEIEKAKREAERAAQESLVMERKAEEQRLTIVREAVERGRREAYAELQERQALEQNRVIEQRQRREQEERFVALREAEIRLEKERQQLQSLRAQGEERMRRTLHDIKNEIRADLLEEELRMRRIERPEMADIPTYRGIELMRDTQRVPNWNRELYSDNYRTPVGFDRSRSPDWFQTLLSPTSSQLELGKGQKYPSFHGQPEVVAGKGAVTESLRFDEQRQFDEDARHATTFSPEYRYRHSYGPGPPQIDAYDSDNATVIPPPASGSSLKSTPARKSKVKDANGGSDNLGSGQITPTLTSGKHSSTTIADMGAQSSTLGIPVKDAKYEEAEYGKGIEGGPIRHYVDNEPHFEALNPRAAEFRPRSRDDIPSGEGTLLPENQSNAIHTGAASQQQGPIGSLPYRPAHGAYYNRPDLSRTHDRKKSSEDYTPRYPVYPRLSVGRGKVPIRPVSYAVEGGIHTRPIMHGISPFLDERSLPIALVPCYILPSYP